MNEPKRIYLREKLSEERNIKTKKNQQIPTHTSVYILIHAQLKRYFDIFFFPTSCMHRNSVQCGGFPYPLFRIDLVCAVMPN